ncbi:Uncharacterised protein [[Flavobacterium] thermophilum]|nr:Uncharacterised protein [[Flavobacterium] thermophilum]
MKCAACNRPIEKPLFWNGRPYGKECWKRVALPEIERMKIEQEKFRLFVARVKAKAIYEAVKHHNDQFIQSVCRYYEQKNFISRKQAEVIYKKLSFAEKLEIVKLAYANGLYELDIIHFFDIVLRVKPKRHEKEVLISFLEADQKIYKIYKYIKEEGITSIYDVSDDEKEEVYQMMKEVSQ